MKTKHSSKILREGIYPIAKVKKLSEEGDKLKLEMSAMVDGTELMASREDDVPDENSEISRIIGKLVKRRLSIEEIAALKPEDVQGQQCPMLVIHRRGTGGRTYPYIGYVFSEGELQEAAKTLVAAAS